MNPGDFIGPYEILAPLGVGGMGEVYRAKDPRIGREIALKLLPKSLAEDGGRLSRFTREAQTAGSLSHPNLVTVFELGRHDGSPYIAMELLEGETLRQKLTGEGTGPKIPLRKAVEYALQILSGLGAAHERGIVHRDLKPENIVITADGRLKILDFGLARMEAPPASEEEQTFAQEEHKTSPGVVLGTAGYMSPEQVRGLPVDHRADIFSFGVILYEMLSGTRPFQGESSIETMNAVLRHDPVDVSSEVLRVPVSLNRVALRCLEKDREQRFQSARDVGFALQAVDGSTVSAKAIALNAPFPLGRIAATAAIALLVAAIAYYAGRKVARVAPVLSVTDVAQLTFAAGQESDPSITRDGKTFVYVSAADGDDDIYLQRVGGRNAINLTEESTAAESAPAISPDGNLIAFVSQRDGNGIYVMGATGESVRRLTDFGFHPAWSPDSKQLVFCTEEVTSPTGRSMTSELWIVDVADGSKKKLYGGDAVHPSWSPDGKRIAFWAVLKGARRDIFTIDASGGEPVAVTDDPALDFRPLWAATGSDLYFLSDRGGTSNLWRVAIDGSGRAAGAPEPVTLPAAAVSSIALSSDSVLYTAAAETMTIARHDVDPVTLLPKGEARPVFSGTMLIRSFDLSADGEWIAFTTEGKEDLYVVKSDGSGLRQLTSDAARDRSPRWSRDGTAIAFYSNRGGNYEIWSVRPDGSELTRLTNMKTPNNWYPQWSPDGRRVAFSDAAAGYITVLGSAQPPEKFPPVSPTETFAPTSWSPSGRWIAGDLSTAIEDRDAAIFDLTTRQYQRLPDGASHPEWLADERDLVYLDDPTQRLIRYNVATAEAHPLPYTAESRIFGRSFALPADRTRLFTSTLRTEADISVARLPVAK